MPNKTLSTQIKLTKIARKFIAKHISRDLKLRVIKLIPQRIMHWYIEQSADVLLISFPKCGRTWLRLMIGRVLQQHFSLETDNILELDKMSIIHNDIPIIRVLHEDNPFWKKSSELVKSKKKYRQKKVIFLVRDPRDVVVSSYYQKKKREGSYDGNLSSYLHEEVGSLMTLINYYNIWANNRHIPKEFMLVRYEDIHADPQGLMRRIINFLDLHIVSDNVIAEAIEYTSFDNMRQMEEEDKFKSFMLRPTDMLDDNSYKVRQGKIGGFKEHFTQEEIKYMNSIINEYLLDIYEYDSLES